jgi:hypothetical protein
MSGLRNFSYFLIWAKYLLAVPFFLLGLFTTVFGLDLLTGGVFILGAIGVAHRFSLRDTTDAVTKRRVVFSSLPFCLAMGSVPISELDSWLGKAILLLLPILTVTDVLVADRLRGAPGNPLKRAATLGRAMLPTAIVLGTIAFFAFGGRSYQPPAMVFSGASEDLHHTAVIPTLDTPMLKGENVIWCGTLQLAWKHLEKDVLHTPPQLQDAEALASRLSQGQLKEDDLPPDSFLATAGFAKNGVSEKVRSEMKRRFHKDAQIDSLEPNDILAYAYIQAAVAFTIPFFDNRKAFRFRDSSGKETEVGSFGIEQKDEYAYERLRQQIEVLYLLRNMKTYAVEEFALDLCRDSSPCQIILACVPPKATLFETLKVVDKKIRDFPRRHFGVTDVLLVPNMNWEIRHHFAELEGADKRFLNTGFSAYHVGKAMQTIRFKLDRSGAELASESKLYCLPIATHFIFDRPFLIYMKKRGSDRPFFVMWVDNGELLCKPRKE